jgi:hypothetical protein
MFDRFVDLVARYPLWIFGGVVAVVLLIWFSSSGSSSEGGLPTVVSVGPSDQTIAANAMIEATRLENQRVGAKAVADQELAKIQADSYKVMLATSREIREIDAEAAVSLANVDASKASSLATIGANAQTTIAGIVTSSQNTQAGIAANAATSIAQIQANQDATRAAVARDIAAMNQQVQNYKIFQTGILPALFQGDQWSSRDVASAYDALNNIN